MVGGGRLQGIKGSLCWHCLKRTLTLGGVRKAARKSITGLAQLLPKPRSASIICKRRAGDLAF